MENELEFDLVYGSDFQLDARGPVVDAAEEFDPVGEFRKGQLDELSKANPGTVPPWMAVPDLAEVLGISTSEDTFVKHDPQPVEEIPLAKGSQLSDEDREFAESRELYRAMWS